MKNVRVAAGKIPIDPDRRSYLELNAKR